MTDSIALLAIANPFPREDGRLLLLEPDDADRTVLADRLRSGTYDKPFIAENGGTRSLFFCWTYVQSRMRIDDPIALQLCYTRTMMCFLLFHTNPRAVLMLGLGGGSLAKYCHHYVPQARITVVESNRDVLALRTAFGVPADDDRFRVVEAEAGAFVTACRDQFDILLMDAFDREGLAPTLCRPEFYDQVRTRLRPDGVLIANIAGRPHERARHIDTMARIFGDNMLVLPVEEDDNDIVFTFRDPTFEPRWRWIESQAEPMRRRYGVEFPSLARALKRRSHAPSVDSIFKELFARDG